MRRPLNIVAHLRRLIVGVERVFVHRGDVFEHVITRDQQVKFPVDECRSFFPYAVIARARRAVVPLGTHIVVDQRIGDWVHAMYRGPLTDEECDGWLLARYVSMFNRY